jgi:tRNA pseudouridine-54 N-methylase
MTDFTGLRFIGIFPSIPLDGKFILKDLPGTGKRVDVLCRSLAACYDWASIKGELEIEFYAIFSHSLLLKFRKPKDVSMKGETWWASSIRESLKGNPPDFVSIEEITLEEFLRTATTQIPDTYVLEEDGEQLDAILNTASAPQYSFMFGDHRGFDERTLQIIEDLEIQKVSLGNRSYLGSHCVAAVISHFERIRE